jgi:hypothetical protein
MRLPRPASAGFYTISGVLRSMSAASIKLFIKVDAPLYRWKTNYLKKSLKVNCCMWIKPLGNKKATYYGYGLLSQVQWLFFGYSVVPVSD